MKKNDKSSVPYGPKQLPWNELKPEWADVTGPSLNPIGLYDEVPPDDVKESYSKISEDLGKDEIEWNDPVPCGQSDDTSGSASRSFPVTEESEILMRVIEETEYLRTAGFWANCDPASSYPYRNTQTSCQ